MKTLLLIPTIMPATIGGATDANQNPVDPNVKSERKAMYERYLDFASLVKGGDVQPHFWADRNRFWYAQGAPDNTIIYQIDPEANTKTPLFDTPRLRKALIPLLGHEPAYAGLPFAEFKFVDGEEVVRFTVESQDFLLQLDTYRITRPPSQSEAERITD